MFISLKENDTLGLFHLSVYLYNIIYTLKDATQMFFVQIDPYRTILKISNCILSKETAFCSLLVWKASLKVYQKATSNLYWGELPTNIE